MTLTKASLKSELQMKFSSSGRNLIIPLRTLCREQYTDLNYWMQNSISYLYFIMRFTYKILTLWLTESKTWQRNPILVGYRIIWQFVDFIQLTTNVTSMHSASRICSSGCRSGQMEAKYNRWLNFELSNFYRFLFGYQKPMLICWNSFLLASIWKPI